MANLSNSWFRISAFQLTVLIYFHVNLLEKNSEFFSSFLNFPSYERTRREQESQEDREARLDRQRVYWQTINTRATHHLTFKIEIIFIFYFSFLFLFFQVRDLLSKEPNLRPSAQELLIYRLPEVIFTFLCLSDCLIWFVWFTWFDLYCMIFISLSKYNRREREDSRGRENSRERVVEICKSIKREKEREP